MSENDIVVECSGLGKRFGEKWAVRGLSLKVKRGSIMGFLGPNGSGKTTTIKMIMGLARPTAGRVRILDADPCLPDRRFLKKVGYLPESQSMIEHFKINDFFQFTSRLYPQWDEELVRRYLDLFDIPAVMRVRELSRGMRNQLGLIAALAPRPEVLVLDDPTSGLDPAGVRKFFGIVLKEVLDRKQTVLISSPNLYYMERVADRAAIMIRGRLAVIKNMDEFKSSEKNIRIAFQGEPPGDIFQMPGISSSKKEGRRYVITVSHNLEDIVDRMHRIPHFAMEIIDLNLEEIFLNYAEEEDGSIGGI